MATIKRYDGSDFVPVGVVDNNLSDYVTETAANGAYPTVFKPEAYGAVADGATNDLAALQSAVDAASPGGVVDLGGNSYAVNSDIIFKTGVTFKGDGATVLLTAARTFWNRINDGATDVTIRGVTFDANGNVGLNGRMLTNNGTGGRWRILDCVFDSGLDPTVTTFQGAVYFEDGDDIKVIDNTFRDCSVSIFAGQQQAADATSATNVVVERNLITGYAGKAIYIQGGTENPRNFRVINNTVIEPYAGALNAAPIWIDGNKTEGTAPTGTPTNSIRNVVVADNYCAGDDTATDTGDMIRMRGVEDGLMSGNEVINGGDKGITVSYGSKNVRVIGNSIDRVDSDAIVMGFPDLTFNDDVTRSYGLVVAGNVSRDIGLRRGAGTGTNYAIRAQNGEGYSIVGNTLYDSQATPTSDNVVRVSPDVSQLEIHGNNYYFVGTEPSSVTDFGIARDDGVSGDFATDYFIDNRLGRWRRRISSSSASPVSAQEFKQWTEVIKTETSGATTAYPWTLAMSEESTLRVRARAFWVKTDHAQRGCYEAEAVFYRNGAAAPVQEGATAKSVVIESIGAFDVDFSVSSNSVRAGITSSSAGDVDWFVELDVTEIVA